MVAPPDEYCLWVTSDPLTVDDARARLRAAVPDLDSRAQRGQIEFVDYRAWYLEDGRLDADRALAGWAERDQRALGQGPAKAGSSKGGRYPLQDLSHGRPHPVRCASRSCSMSHSTRNLV